MTLVELVITISIILLITTLCFPSDNVEKYQVNSFIKQLCSDIRYVRNINMMGNTNAYVYLNNNDEGSGFTLNENKKDRTVFMTAKSITRVSQIADRIIILESGTIVRDSPPEEMRTNFSDDVVLVCPSLNI